MISVQPTKYEVGHSSFDAPGMLCQPALVDYTAMDPHSSSAIPFGTSVENLVPDSTSLNYAVRQTSSIVSALSHELFAQQVTH